ncbi:MAG: efflux RND transporter permease subunit [Myxococcota bacterium]
MEQIIQYVLRNRLLVVALGVLLSAAGLRGYLGLPVDAFPDVSPNLVQIFTVTEGLSPDDVEKYVTYPVETAMTGLPGVQKIRSVSNFGLSVVNVYFEDGLDIYFARQIVNERLQEAREAIPEGFGEPGMGPISTGMGLVLFYYLDDATGKYSLEELRTLQDWVVKFHLQTVPGVTEVLGIGGWEKQFQVRVRPEALLSYDVTIGEIIDIIRENNLNVGAQFIEKNAEEYIVRSMGLAAGVEDLDNIVVKSVDGTPVFLHELADVETGGAIRRGVQTRNGVEEVVAGMVIKLFGSNASSVIGRVEQKVSEINKILPDGVRIVPYYEQKTIVEAAVRTVTKALIEGIALVTLVLVVFMGGFRASVVLALAIPFSVFFATLWMGVFDMSANLMSLGGLAIAIGMRVDGTVVMVENVDRMLRSATRDEGRMRVVERACVEVARPIAFGISIIVIVFLPLFTLEGVEGKTFRPLAYTIALSMTGSLLFAIALAPVFSYLVMRRPRRTEESAAPHAGLIMEALMRVYRPLVTFFVRRRDLAIGLAVALLAIGAAVFPFLGSEFTPKLQEGTMVLRLTMAPSISLRESTRVTQIVERRVMEVHEVSGVVTRIGRGEVGAHTDPVNSAEMYILLKPESEWRAENQEEIQALIRDEVGQIPGVLTNFTQPIEMTVDELLEGVRAELAIKLFGDDLDVLAEKAGEISQVVGDVRGAADVQVDQVSGTPQVAIRVNRQAVARYGINVADVQRTVRAAVGGAVAGQVLEGIRRFDIYVRFARPYRETIEDIENILVRAPGDVHVPLAELADIREIVGPRQITREDNQRFITVQCNVVDRDIGSFVKEAQAAIDRTVDLPPGYLVTWGGEFELQQQANRRLAVVVPITLLILFLLLFLSFNSVKNAVLIFLNIPLALVGGIVALALSGQHLSVPATVGFIALFGIALLNGLVLVSYLNQLLRNGFSTDQASIEGACLRLRPVVMTALVAGLGLVPLLLSSGTGSEVQRPLATVVLGGLVTSTTLTLLVIPAIYKWFTNLPYREAPAEPVSGGETP